MPNHTTEDYSKKANEARKKVLTMIHKARTSHIASNFSVIDIATVLYDNLKDGDEVVWSAGWKAATIYYFLAQQGKIPTEDLEKFGKEIDGKIPYLGLAETNVPGVLVNGGAVGHGLPIAAGMALAKQRNNEPGIVYCILSDGELNEGTVWEAVMFIAHHKLPVAIIVDSNKWQAMGRTEDVIDINSKTAFAGFGLTSVQIDGHDFEKLKTLFSVIKNHLPIAITADTIKGKGVSFMENHLLFHYKHVEKDEYEKAMAELERND